MLLLALLTTAHAGEDHLTPVVQLQGWATVWDFDEDPQADPASYGDPEHDPGFTVRRARLGMMGAQGPLDFRIELGHGAPYDALSEEPPPIQLIAAEGGWSTDAGASELGIDIGLIKVPFSREFLMSSRDLVFMERAVSTNWMAPAYDAGLQVDYHLDMGLRFRAGVFNGNGSAIADDNVGVLAAARAEFATGGDTYRTWDPERETAFGVALSGLYNADVATNTLGLSADLLFRVSGLTLLAELQRNTLKPGDSTIAAPDVLGTVNRMGINGQVSWFQPIGEGTGGLETAARFSTFDDAAHLDDNGDVGILDAGITWRDVSPGFDIGAGYILRLEMKGRSIPNDTVRLWAQIRFPGVGSKPVVDDATE